MNLSETDVKYIRRLERGNKQGAVSVAVVWVIVFGYLGFRMWRGIEFIEVAGFARVNLAMQLWIQMWQDPTGHVTWEEVFLIEEVTSAIFFLLAGLLISFFRLLDIRQNRIVATLWSEISTEKKTSVM